MSEYSPDNWVVLKITTPEDGVYRKILAGWSGSYLYGQSWKLSSAIENEKETDTHIIFDNASGSRYSCYKSCYGLSAYTSGIYQNFIDGAKGSGVLVEIDEEISKRFK
jgi:hypothetical protein